ncbi:hypothetical protein QJS04_geneDACA020356 [Acorus gramineus]|uniref:Zinc finger PHD-type domain-containing protein n=1 Tax=Acorus gramineus TaxID=55184 RepID=A0AAV9ADL1_ACOGR|nr:hypothetical protein QJS04_geneDACA020356 [Acorus gramineus]
MDSMKGRSNHHNHPRMPISGPMPPAVHGGDDWGDGSWTVDCVCGVNFDDGEEMVDCDECGVWVHTRCSRFVKGEASFVCDKCKQKRSHCYDNGDNDNEETEVAQLLVELPTKTLRMARQTPVAGPTTSFNPPFRFWKEFSIEDRVHVQGIPGGDPSVFGGLSSAVFSSELWKCTGYVPKKFNFRYREFPCWDDDVGGGIDGEEGEENPANRGADVLFSLSKEIIRYDSSPNDINCASSKSRQGVLERELLLSPTKGVKKRALCTGKKDIRASSNKEKKERLESGGVKRARSSTDRRDKRRGLVPPSVVCKLDLSEGGGNTFYGRGMEGEEKMDFVIKKSILNNHSEAGVDSDRHKQILAINISNGSVGDDTSGIKVPPDFTVKEEITEERGTMGIGSDALPKAPVESDGLNELSIKNEAVDDSGQINDERHYLENLNKSSSGVAVDLQNAKPSGGDLENISSHAHLLPPQDRRDAIHPRSLQAKTEKTDSVDDQATTSGEQTNSSSLPEQTGKSTGQLSDKLQVQGVDGQECHNSERKSVEVNHCTSDKSADEMAYRSGELHSQKPDSVRLFTESSSEAGNDAKHAKNPVKSMTAISCSSAQGPAKAAVDFGKSALSSSRVLSKSSVSGSCKPPSTPASSAVVKPFHPAKQRVKVNAYSTVKKISTESDVSRNQSMKEVPKQFARAHLKGPINSGSKLSHGSRISPSPTLKRIPSDSKEQQSCSTSKATTSDNSAFSSLAGDSTSWSQTPNASSLQPKTTSHTCQKNEKNNNFSPDPLTKGSDYSVTIHLPSVNVAAVLSDEELALLLHQELNSSPRVPRVPRVRHAGGQLGAPTATSLLAKRTSGLGVKDQNHHLPVPRRKGKEEAKDGSRISREAVDESKKMLRVPSSPDQKRQEIIFPTDGCDKDAYGRSDFEVPFVPSASSGLPPIIEANGQNQLPTFISTRESSDGNGAVLGHAPRTLPGI